MWRTQGSILDHKLVLLYTSDICNISTILNFTLFADDVNTACSGEVTVQLSKDITIELQKLHVWFSVNRLSLVVAKTNYMVFTNSGINLNIDNTSIDRVYVSKILGGLIPQVVDAR